MRVGTFGRYQPLIAASLQGIDLIYVTGDSETQENTIQPTLIFYLYSRTCLERLQNGAYIFGLSRQVVFGDRLLY